MGKRFQYRCQFIASINICLMVFGGGKLFALTGWRVAWAYGPKELVQPLSVAHTHLTFNAPTPPDTATSAFSVE